MAKKTPARAKAAKAAAKKRVTPRSAKRPKSRAARSSSRKSRAAKKATPRTVRNVAPKSTAKRKPVAVRKAAPRKMAAKKVAAKKVAARKVTTKKGAAKTVVTRKMVASNTRAKPRVAKRVPAKKVIAKAVTKKAVAKNVGTKQFAAPTLVARPPVAQATTPATAKSPAASKRPPALDRARKSVGKDYEPHGLPSSLDLDRTASSARSGHNELVEKLRNHSPGGPAITAGDVDADWEAAESVGDEAPGGDNPTPDQDVVDEIGKALGVEYDDDEELKGGDEIADRDRHRWELDPGSAEDVDDK